MTFCEGPPREGVIRLRCAYLELCTAISSRKRALPHGGHPLKYAASDSTMGQRRVGAVCAAIHAIEGHHQNLQVDISDLSFRADAPGLNRVVVIYIAHRVLC